MYAALSKNPVVYHRGDRRGRRVLRLIRASAFSAYSAVKLEDIIISLDFPIVPVCEFRDYTHRKRKGEKRIKRALLFHNVAPVGRGITAMPMQISNMQTFRFAIFAG